MIFFLASNITLSDYAKIAVIGISASGKSTFSRRLSWASRLPVVHVDSIIWAPGWNEREEREWLSLESECVACNSWIIEGYINPRYVGRLTAADLVVFLDLPGFLCAFNGFRRWLQYRATPRPELREGCFEKLSLPFLTTLLFRRERAELKASLYRTAPHKVVIIKSRRQAEHFLSRIVHRPEWSQVYVAT
jgi:adenylate kinase family enzyme